MCLCLSRIFRPSPKSLANCDLESRQFFCKIRADFFNRSISVYTHKTISFLHFCEISLRPSADKSGMFQIYYKKAKCLLSHSHFSSNRICVDFPDPSIASTTNRLSFDSNFLLCSTIFIFCGLFTHQ